VEYALTAHGGSIRILVGQIIQWGFKHRALVFGQEAEGIQHG
jgi:DNA-binding HxlR family transcriptional regulator